MRTSRYVPLIFTFAGDDAVLNTLLRELADLFKRAEREDSRGIALVASGNLSTYLDGVQSSNALVTAYRMMNFERTECWSEEWRGAIFSSMGFAVFETWLEDYFQREFSAFIVKHGLVLLFIEERGPSRTARFDLERGGVVQSPTHGRIAYIHLKGRHDGSVFPGFDVIVPLTPPSHARLIRTQPNGTKVYELDLSLPRID